MESGKIDVMIPTLNESTHIVDAVTNARQVGQVFVLDSLSTDGTQELAREAGATVVEHRFEGYAEQKNWGLKNLPMNGEWVFILDADERLTPKLRDELLELAATPGAANGYYVNRQMVFMGQQIRHGGLYPSWNLRFFRRGKCFYEYRRVHEHMLCDGPRAYCKGEMVHVRLETMEQYIRKHVRYADLEAVQWTMEHMGEAQGEDTSRLFSDVLGWRQFLRRKLWPRMIARPLLRFLYMYIARLGVLDGIAGWRLAMLMASYEYMIGLLYHEKMQAARLALDEAAQSQTPSQPVGAE